LTGIIQYCQCTHTDSITLQQSYLHWLHSRVIENGLMYQNTPLFRVC